MIKRSWTLVGVAVLALLAGCSADVDELRQWMEQQHREVKATVTPLLPPKKFLPQPYEAGAGVDPFSPQKLSVAIKQEAVQPNSLLTAEINRRKEELEQFPLDSMSMIGWMFRAEEKKAYALLRVDNQTFKVSVGNYLGQNFGRITKISETAITLREVVQDAAGEWIERTSTLQLQEKGR
ncbi:pilus assembly protein PilP [Roseateles paludis]|jgi:type IV pilus assembly protein PilP|uniref:Pilus assembly protein PilP n=1 Tax=Roseateles paludis TaxID=3145238 RepID=A0ABV0G4I9_9BURK